MQRSAGFWVCAIAAGVIGVGAVAGCVRPPVGGGPPPPPPAGRIGPVAFDTFVQDRPAIAGKWYDYDPTVHTLNPKPQAWILRDASTGTARFAAFRIVTVYDAATAESGVFTLSVATFDTASSTWSAEAPWTSPRNVKTSGPLCTDLFGGGDDVDCTGTAWQLRLAFFQYFSPPAGIAVQDPGLFVRSVDGTDAFGDVSIARLDAADLTALPDPTTLADLADAAPASFDGTDWDFSKLGRDLPRAGMAVGSQFGNDDVWWMMTQRYSLLRLQMKPGADDGHVHFRYAAVDVDRSDNSIPEKLPPALDVEVAVPAVGQAQLVTFSTADLALAAADVDGTAYPFALPKNAKWDLAIEQPSDGDVRIMLSPDVCVLDATQLGLDENKPPVSSP